MAFPAPILTENHNCSPTLHNDVPHRILNKSDTTYRQYHEIPFPPLRMPPPTRYLRSWWLLGNLLHRTSLSSRSKCFKNIRRPTYDNRLHFQFQAFRVSVAAFPNVNQSVTFARKVNKTQRTTPTLGVTIDAQIVLEFFASPVIETGHNLFVTSPYFAIASVTKLHGWTLCIYVPWGRRRKASE